MECLPRARQDRTGFARRVADRDDDVEREALQRLDGLAAVRRDVDAPLAHDADRERMNGRGLRPRGMHVDAVTEVVADPALAHLGSAGVARAEDQDARLAHAKYRRWNQNATLTRPIITGTSTSGPMTAAKAAPESIPNTATATAIASSKLLLAAVKASVVVLL